MSEEIEHLIHSYAGVVVVQITEPILEADQQMDWIGREIKQRRPDVNVIQVAFSLHREWALTYRVYGSPCTLVFHQGELRLRVQGRFGREHLRAVLERVGLFDLP